MTDHPVMDHDFYLVNSGIYSKEEIFTSLMKLTAKGFFHYRVAYFLALLQPCHMNILTEPVSYYFSSFAVSVG